MKKILLFLIDSMMPHVLNRCLEHGKTPTLQFFCERGQYIDDCVTVFPTMTTSVDCSLITGVYPDQHHVPGLVWYDPEAKRIVNYINSMDSVLALGINECAQNVIFDLNQLHLSKQVKTIHEELEEQGYTSGSINVIAHRGHKKHQIKLPLGLQLLTGFSMGGTVSGPTFLGLGTFIKPAIFRQAVWNYALTPFYSYGINDTYSIDMLIELVKSGQQPDFTLIYLPDNDHRLHKAPHLAEEHLAMVDREIARFLDTYDSWTQALEQNVFIFISDHGQTVVGESEAHNIYLEKLFHPFRIPKLNETIQEEDQLIICNNERMCYLYPLNADLLPEVAKAAASDERIDLVAWKEGEAVKVLQGSTGNQLLFQPGGPHRDIYENGWFFQGDLSVLDVRRDQSGALSFDSYPDAFSRLYGALFSQPVEVVVITARPGCEFVSERSPVHLGGGSHGSLHKTDSVVPVIIAGTEQILERPARIVDLKSFVMKVLAAETVPV